MVFGRLLGLQNHLKSIKHRKNVPQKIDAKKVWCLETIFQKIIGFSGPFWSQNPSKIDSEVKSFEKRKTFQNTAYASKNQGFAFPKLTEKHEKQLENRYKNKVHQKVAKY